MADNEIKYYNNTYKLSLLKVIMQIITPKTRVCLQREWKKTCGAKSRSRLQAAVSGVLNDKDVFAFLASYLPPGKGLNIGNIPFFDDIQVNAYYGLIFDADRAPRGVKLFYYEDYGDERYRNLILTSHFPDCTGSNPSPEQFLESVNRALQSPQANIVAIPLERRVG